MGEGAEIGKARQCRTVCNEGGADFEIKMMKSVLEISRISKCNGLGLKKGLIYANLGAESIEGIR